MRFGFILLIMLSFYNCSYSDEWTLIDQDDFTIEMPPYTSELEDITNGGEVLLEYGSMFRNFYVVIKKLPQANAKIAAAFHVKELLNNNNFTDAFIIDEKTFELNGNYCQKASLRGNVGKQTIKEKITYNLYFVENNKGIYQLIIWNWSAKDDFHKADIDKIVNSFKLK